MPDIVSLRQTIILVADDNGLYPSEYIYPANDLFPRDAGLTEITNIVAGSLKLDELISERIPQFGQLYSTKFECKVYLVDDLKGKFIQVYQLDGNAYRSVFMGQIDSCKLDKLGTDRTIVAYDFGYTKGQINVAPWWTEFWSDKETATLKQARNSMLKWAAVSYEDVELPNDNLQITKTVDITSCTFTSMLRMMCELNYCFPHFNRMGTLTYVFLNTDPEQIVDLTGLYEGTNSQFEDFETLPIDGVQFYDSGNQLKWTTGQTDNAYPIKKNIFLYEKGTEMLDALGHDILDYLQDLIYVPAKVKMIVGDFELGLGDYVHTEQGNFYVLQNKYSGSQLIEQTIEAQGQELLYGGTPHIDYGELVLNEKIARVNFTIEEFKIEYADFKEQTNASLTINADAIETEVSRATQKENKITDDLSSEITRATREETNLSSRITQTAEDISTEVTRATTKETQIVNNLNGEITRATREESNLSSRITQNAESITSEVTRATTKETTITTNLNNEVTRATNAEGALSSRITTETTNLSSRITQNAESITSEVTRATEVEESIFANYIGTVVPTTSNAPASSWNTDAKKAAHVRETYYNKTTKKYYRWTATKSGSTVTYNWQAIDTTTARSYSVVSSTIKQTADSLTSEITAETSRATGEESSLSTRITQTVESITSEVSRATSAEGNLDSRITQTADAISSEVTRATNAEGSLSTRITQTAESISSEVSRASAAEGALDSKITQTAESISLDVSNGETSSTIVLKLGETQLSSKTIQMTGLVTFSNLSSDGQTTINGNNITTGTIDASRVSVTNLNADNITSGTISADKIKGGQLTIDPETGWATAIVVKRNNTEYIKMSAQDGIQVNGSTSLSLTSSGLSVGSGSIFNAVEISARSSNSGQITVGGSSNNQTVISDGSITAQSLTVKATSITIGNNAFSSTTGYLIEGVGYTAPTFSEIKDVDLSDDSLWAVDAYSAPTMKGNYSNGYNFASSPTWKKISLSKSSYSTKIYGMSCGYSGPSISSKTILAK